MTKKVVVNKYKYSHEKKRNILKRMARQGLATFEGRTSDEFYYSLSEDNFNEFLNRIYPKRKDKNENK